MSHHGSRAPLAGSGVRRKRRSVPRGRPASELVPSPSGRWSSAQARPPACRVDVDFIPRTADSPWEQAVRRTIDQIPMEPTHLAQDYLAAVEVMSLLSLSAAAAEARGCPTQAVRGHLAVWGPHRVGSQLGPLPSAERRPLVCRFVGPGQGSPPGLRRRCMACVAFVAVVCLVVCLVCFVLGRVSLIACTSASR